MSFKTTWINIIYKTATGSRKTRFLLTPAVGLSYLLFTAMFAIVALLLERWFRIAPFPPAPIGLNLGIPLSIIGVLLSLWCLWHFIKVKGTPVPFNPPPILVTNGPYAFVRNPMLTGVFLLLFGLGFILQSVFLIFVFTPLFITLNVIEIKTIEETELAIRLGQDYLDYKKKTPMFFPKLRYHREKRKDAHD